MLKRICEMRREREPLIFAYRLEQGPIPVHKYTVNLTAKNPKPISSKDAQSLVC